jgi:nuclease S1
VARFAVLNPPILLFNIERSEMMTQENLPKFTWSLLIATIFFVSSSITGFAWGNDGHRAVARIAWSRLTPAAQARINTLLANDPQLATCQANHLSIATPRDRFVCIATWADDVRDARPETRLWHFVDIPLDVPTYLATRDCVQTDGGDCVIKAIERQFAILTNPNADANSRSEALKFIVHFVGDMHQPLHDAADFHDPEALAAGYETDRGGNKKFVRFFQDFSNLHSVWDSGIIRRMNLNTLQNELTPQQKAFSKPLPVAANWSATLPQVLIKWAQEGHALAVSNAYKIGPRFQDDVATDPDTGKKFHRFHLGQNYLNINAGKVSNQLRTASVRLARILNEGLR